MNDLHKSSYEIEKQKKNAEKVKKEPRLRYSQVFRGNKQKTKTIYKNNKNNKNNKNINKNKKSK